MIALHGNSSLPRSGSELLQALLSQHPQIYASATSPLLEYWYGALGNYDLPERKSQSEAGMQRAMVGFMRYGAQGYYNALTNRQTVIDKSRGWLEHAEILWQAYPEARIICMVRPVEEIIDSLERAYRAYPGHPETRMLPRTFEQRAQLWASSGNFPLGLALDRLKERQARGKEARIEYIQYADLISQPIDVMRAIFTHYGVEPIDVDPMNIRKAVPEDDSFYGIFGKHNVAPMIQSKTKQIALNGEE